MNDITQHTAARVLQTMVIRMFVDRLFRYVVVARPCLEAQPSPINNNKRLND